MNTPLHARIRLTGRRAVIGVAVLTASLLLAGCGGSGGSDPSAAGTAKIVDGGELRVALTGEPDVLDPATSSIYTGAQVYEGIFSKSIDIDPRRVCPAISPRTWNQDDPKTWTFDLVDNATFHNGEKFTSADVMYTFKRILDPKTASAYAGLYDADRLGRGSQPHDSGLPPQAAVRPVPHQPGDERRDREPEGDGVR